MGLFKRSQRSSSENKSVVGRNWLRVSEKLTWRHYAFAAIGALVLAGGILIFAASPAAPVYSGKLLGMNSSFGDLPASQTNILSQLGVNSERGEIDFNGSTFDSPSYDGTTDNWVGTLTTNHIVPLPMFNQYIELSTINVPQFTAATVSWCKQYCAGGSFYANNSQANGSYAPQMLEILNEPYGNWWAQNDCQGKNPCPDFPNQQPPDYNLVPADVTAYANLLKSVRAGLDSAGLTNIGITGAADDNVDNYSGWDTALINNGGFAAVQGIVVHAYGDVNLAQDVTGTTYSGWGQVYYVHQLLANAGLSAHANMYVTEVGYCTANGGDCVGGNATEAVKDANIATIINQLATVSWLKGFWYFNLHPYEESGTYNSFGLYDPSGNKTPAWAAFQSAATTTEAQNPAEFSLSPPTAPPPPDTTVPTVSISSPVTGAIVSGTTTVSANASDNIGVASVQFKVDGAVVGSPDTASPYTFSWNTAGATNGTHTLTAVAADAAGNTATSNPITVTVSNKTASPPPDTTPPSTPAGLSATVASSAEVDLSWKAATDNVGVTAYKIYRNGSATALTTVTAPTVTYRDVAVSAGTTYTYTITAVDAAGNQSAKSSSVGATTPAAADKTAPSAPTGLTSTVITTTSVGLSWQPSTDNTGGSGLAGYHLYRNGILVASPTGTTYTDSGLSPATSYTYSVSAYDKAANGSVASVVFTVKTTTPTTTSVQNFTWNATTKTLHWSAYPGATYYTIATVHNPTTTRNTDYTYPPVSGTGWTPPVLNGETVHYGISPDIKNSDGSYTAVTGSIWASEVSVTWPSTTPVTPAPAPAPPVHHHHWWQFWE